MRETLSPFVPFGGEGGNSFISLYFQNEREILCSVQHFNNPGPKFKNSNVTLTLL